MKEINVDSFVFKDWQNIHHAEKDDFLSLKVNLARRWGKTYFYYDKSNRKLYSETLTIIGQLLHKVFGYRKELNRNNFWEFVKTQIKKEEACPSAKNFRKVASQKLAYFYQAKDVLEKKICGNGSENNEDAMIQLFNEGLDVNTLDSNDATPLHRAIRANKNKLAKYLMEHGADVNTRKDKGGEVFMTPLAIAVYINEEMVEPLLQHGADVNAKDWQNKTALHYAVGSEAQSASVRMEMDYDWKINKKIVAQLLEKNCDVNVVDDHGASPLFYAVSSEDMSVVQLLIGKGADVNLCGDNKISHLPITAAVCKNNADLVKVLLDHGAKVDLKSSIYTIHLLHFAAKEGYKEVAEHLVKSSDVNTVDDKGRTPLHWAVESGYLEMAKFLITQGADVKVKDIRDHTPLDLARTEAMQSLLK